jgi:hypothetical protein
MKESMVFVTKFQRFCELEKLSKGFEAAGARVICDAS